MKVYIHSFGIGLIEKSGVGRAIHHQCEMLERSGISVSTKNIKDSDFVHINTVFPDSLLVCLFARLTGRKIIYYAHSTMEDFRNSFIGSNLVAPLFKKWITFCYNHGDLIVTPTEYSKSLLSGYGIRKPIVAVSNGIDNSFWNKPVKETSKAFKSRYRIKESSPVVMSVGHMIERKGITDFIELAKKMPEVTFIWFGYTPPSVIPANIKEAIKGAPVNLIFAGYVPKEELCAAYHSCDLFCFMSHEETEGIVVLEALSSGIPTIVRDIGVYDDWLSDNKNVKKCSTLSDFENAVSDLLHRDNSSLIKEGLRTAKSRDYKVIANKLRRQYELLLYKYILDSDKKSALS